MENEKKLEVATDKLQDYQGKVSPASAQGQTSATRVLEIATLVVALCATACLFSLPIIFHFVLEGQSFTSGGGSSGNLSAATTSSTLTNSSTANTTNTASLCERDFSWSVQTLNFIDDQYCVKTGYKYVESVCTVYLNEWSACAMNGRDFLVNETDTPQSVFDNEINTLSDLLDQYPICKEPAIPFLCQYFFPIKDCTTGRVFVASREDCVYVSTKVCGSLWQLAILTGHGDRLPDCDSLPLSVNTSMSDFLSNNDTRANDTAIPLINITCSSQFDRVNNTCVPRCDRFEAHSSIVTNTLNACEIVAVIIGLLVCFLIIAFAAPNYKNMLTFPSIFLLFIVVDYISGAIIVIISAADRIGLYCSSVSLFEALQSPTPFCSISGAGFHYVIVNMTVWWFFHVAAFFYKVMFPFHARRMQKDSRNKYIFIFLVIIGILIPLPGVIATMTTGGYQLTRFPPSICSTSGDIYFYSVTVVIDLLIGTGVCLLIIIFWIIHTNQHFHLTNRGKKKHLSTAEKKIMIVFISFIIFGVYTMIQTGIVTAHSDELRKGITDYLTCESTGGIAGECDRAEYLKYSHPYLLAVTFILLGLIPLSILNFVVNVRTTKAFIMKTFRISRKEAVSSTNVSSQYTSATSAGSFKIPPNSPFGLPPNSPFEMVQQSNGHADECVNGTSSNSPLEMAAQQQSNGHTHKSLNGAQSLHDDDKLQTDK